MSTCLAPVPLLEAIVGETDVVPARNRWIKEIVIENSVRYSRGDNIKDLKGLDKDLRVLQEIDDRPSGKEDEFPFKGESYRLREKRKAGLLGRRAATPAEEVPADGAA